MLQAFRKFVLLALCRPLAKFVFGLDVLHKERLPENGPAIIIANHNSHIDTFLLLTMMPSRLLPKLRPVAAADYFMRGGVLQWLSLNVIGILPIKRKVGRDEDPLADSKAALAQGEVLILFPEGTRGAPEEMGAFKSGVARLAAACPEAPVIPVYLQGAGRSLPKGERVIVPFSCTAVVGEALPAAPDKAAYLAEMKAAFDALQAEAPPLRWD